MKAPAFWYQPAGMTAKILSPLSCLFQTGAAVRKLLAHPYRAKIPVICVGNIVAGGSGKTPTALALAALLIERGYRPAFVTRGYGGSERGVLRVDPALHTAAQVGDEALLLARLAPTWMGRDRVAAIQQAEKSASHIIMDDGLQNPNVLPEIGLMIVDGVAGFGNGYVIPAGPLRETLGNALRRVHAILVVNGQNPEGIPANVTILKANLRAINPPTFDPTDTYFAFAGIGRPEKFYETCRASGMNIIGTHNFADHHVFIEKEMHDLKQAALRANAKLLTTEKDYVRLPDTWRKDVHTLPIQLVFEKPEAILRLLKV